MTETRPREHAAQMLLALRSWWAEYQQANIPKEFWGMTNAYVVSEMAKGLSKRSRAE